MNEDVLSILKISKDKIWDIIRKKWLIATPEEVVRQKLLKFLVDVKQYPKNFIMVEKEIIFNGIKKRIDILVYSSNFKPYLLVECKKEKIKLEDKNVVQILSYSLSLNPNYIALTNGIQTKIFERRIDGPFAISHFPDYI